MRSSQLGGPVSVILIWFLWQSDKIGKPGIIVHGVAIRPGMPTALAILEGKPVFVLSGNPVAATVGFEAFARPTLLRMLGRKRV